MLGSRTNAVKISRISLFRHGFVLDFPIRRSYGRYTHFPGATTRLGEECDKTRGALRTKPRMASADVNVQSASLLKETKPIHFGWICAGIQKPRVVSPELTLYALKVRIPIAIGVFGSAEAALQSQTAPPGAPDLPFQTQNGPFNRTEFPASGTA
jgi:hypothetical protein